MKYTFDYILYCQSPALFLAALALLVCFLSRVRSRKFLAGVDLVLSILALVGGLALYYLGMYYEHFTIRDFWHIRMPGWVGLLLMLVVILALLYRSIIRGIARRRSAKQAARAEEARIRELEEAKNSAYASGRADAEAAAAPAVEKREDA